ncbi:P-loop containing nucleoside triphosphate hydrolase protein [Lentinula edodes]|nr:P-loop containing nucleoside triphosphate hydrolase protein [Lentinula edodes]
MSKLNAEAFEFRPEQTEAPRPPPTISFSIGGSKPSAPTPIVQHNPAAAIAPSNAPTSTPASSQAKSTPVPARTFVKVKSDSPAPPTAPSKTFSLQKSKTDTNAIAKEMQAAADKAVMDDLFGNAKEHLIIVFIGHVDAGKSTLGGNLLFITGAVDKRTMEKYEKEARKVGRETCYLSWALNSTPQERLKGKTVEEDTFVPSMISGAAQPDIVILRGGQTPEHIMLVKTAGVSKLVIVINKMDDPTVLWDKARYNEIKDKLTPFLEAAGCNPKTYMVCIPVSACTGLGLGGRVPKTTCPCWNGPSFLEHMDHMPMVDRKINAPLMMPIESGHMHKDDRLVLMPNKDQVESAAIYNEIEDEVPDAFYGDNVRIRIRSVDGEDINPGFVLTSPSKPIHAVRQFEAQLAILEHKRIICAGYSAVMHVHTLAEEVTLVSPLHYFDKATGRKLKKPPQYTKKGPKIFALIETTAPGSVERFTDYPQLGRFTLRHEGRTIAIGKGTEEITDGVANLVS